MRSYIFRVEFSQGDDGRWNAVVPSLPACYTWGKTSEEALAFMQDGVKCCVEDMLAHGEPLPEDLEVIEAPVASVTVGVRSRVAYELVNYWRPSSEMDSRRGPASARGRPWRQASAASATATST